MRTSSMVATSKTPSGDHEGDFAVVLTQGSRSRSLVKRTDCYWPSSVKTRVSELRPLRLMWPEGEDWMDKV
eukprot:scaffold57213_cov17-Tisochrysis_lutea.AAC.1